MRDSEEWLQFYEDTRDHADDDWQMEAAEVMHELQNRLMECDNPIDRSNNFTAAQKVLCDIAAENNNSQDVINVVKKWSTDIAKKAQINKQHIIESATLQLKELRREQNEKKLEKGAEGYSLDWGIGIDEYVEQHLDRIVQLDTLDHVTDSVLVFEFDDGTNVKFEDGKHRNVHGFYDAISIRVKGVQIREKIASLQAREDIDGDIKEDEYAEKQYRRLSHGPEERPWGFSWNEVITHLEEDKREEIDRVAGPNTDAWETLQDKIRNGRAARDKQSVVDAGNGAMFYCEDYSDDEIWVPTTMVDRSIGDFATNRTQFVHELDSRGVTTDEISGKGCSHADKKVNPPTRFWRLKAKHADIPDCPVVDVLDNDINPFADVDSGTSTDFTAGAGGD